LSALISVILLISSGEVALLQESLTLNLEAKASRSSGLLYVVASAVNTTSEPVEFCGRWGYEVKYVPNSEGEEKLAAYKARQEHDQLEAEENGKVYTPKCGPQLDPVIFDIGGIGPENYEVEIFPGEVFSDTVKFQVNFEFYEDWPGEIEVRYGLDLCEDKSSTSNGVPRNGLGGKLVTSFSVP
jgi:hypothetical protein